MRFVVTGATGLVGANLALLLREAGHDVRCTRRAGSRSRIGHLDGHGIEWIEADVTDAESLPRSFDGADGVFHCAAAVSVRRKITPEMVLTNVVGTRNVARAVRRAGAGRLVHVSSVVAVGLSEDGRAVDESARWNFDREGLDDAYAITKRDAEQVIAEELAAGGLDAVIVNPAYMFGPYDQRPSSGAMIIDVARRKTPGSSTGINNFVDVRDVCRSMIAAHARGRRGERYILGGHNLRYAEIFRRIATIAGVKPPSRIIPRWLARPIGWAGDLAEAITGKGALINSNTLAWAYTSSFHFTSAKAERELGHAISPIEPAIEDAIGWFREHGMLRA